jgi:hypothetical protein
MFHRWLGIAAGTSALVLLACEHPRPNYAGLAGAGGPGTAGTTGSAGTSGSAGDSGSPGSAGTSGNAGNAGNTGNTGLSGTTGSAGTSGDAGTTGSAGTSGAAGISGSAGTSGDAGTSGSAGTNGSGTNLITNGDFSSGSTDWHVEGGGNLEVMNGQLCVSGWGTASLLGWASGGAPVMLSQGVQYRLSYQASASAGSAMMHIKVGLADPPYTSDYETDVTLSSTLQSFMHTFTPAQNDARNGIAFTFSGTTNNNRICLDNVSIVRL